MRANHHDCLLKFQFLYGTIKTQLILSPISGIDEFQFLYGTIKTLQQTLRLIERLIFQFLYGTIKTIDDGYCCCI